MQSAPEEGGGAEEGSSHGHDISTVAPAEGGGAEEGSSHGHDISTVVPAEGGGAEEGSSHGHDISTVVPAEGGGAEEGSSHGHDISTVELPLLSDKESLDILASYCKSDCSDLPGDIPILGEFYASIRRTRLDGNSFLRSFTFSILEHLLETQDTAEVDHIKSNIEKCRMTLEAAQYPAQCVQALLQPFIELLNGVIQGTQTSISAEELLRRCQSPEYSDPVVKLFRYITSGQIRMDQTHYVDLFWEVAIKSIDVASVHELCKEHVEPMGQESHHIHITALADALRVPIRLQYFPNMPQNYQDYIPSSFPKGKLVEPYVKILYCSSEYYDIPHYAILYPEVTSFQVPKDCYLPRRRKKAKKT